MFSSILNRLGDVLTIALCAAILGFGALSFANAATTPAVVSGVITMSATSAGGALSQTTSIAPVVSEGSGGALNQN